MKFKVLLLIVTYSLTTPLSGQNLVKNNSYSLNSSLFLSNSEQLPFWLRSNQYGEVPLQSQFLQLKGSVHHEYDSLFNKNKELQRFGIGYGIVGLINTGKVNQAILSESYIKVRQGFLELYAGRRKEIIGLVDSTLSTGSYIWSGNALPLPKIELSIPNYIPITKNKLLSIKASYSHGWFGSTDSVENYYLHQKTFYTRVGKPNWGFKFYAGFNHQVQWGGKPTIPFYDAKTDQIINKYPSNFATYAKVVTGISLNKDLDAGTTKDGIPANDAFNRAGNHLGTIDISLEYETSFGQILIYRQSIYEDGSLFHLNNISDGLLGVSFKTKAKNSLKHFFYINKINLEYLDTRSQGGQLGSNSSIPELRGGDNYLNNGLYKDGYSYKGFNIGTPLIMPLSNYKDAFPSDISNKFNTSYLLNNRLTSYSAALKGILGLKINYLLKYSFSQNLGSYQYPISRTQHSFFSQFIYQNKDWNYGISIGIDSGTLLTNSFGTRLFVERSLF